MNTNKGITVSPYLEHTDQNTDPCHVHARRNTYDVTKPGKAHNGHGKPHGHAQEKENKKKGQNTCNADEC